MTEVLRAQVSTSSNGDDALSQAGGENGGDDPEPTGDSQHWVNRTTARHRSRHHDWVIKIGAGCDPSGHWGARVQPASLWLDSGMYYTPRASEPPCQTQAEEDPVCANPIPGDIQLL